MSIQFLKKELNNYKGWERTLLGFTNGTIDCLEAFLQFLAANPNIISQFLGLIQTFDALASATISTLELMVAQLNVINQVANAVMQPVKSLTSQTKGQMGLFGWDKFDNCPPVAWTKEFLVNGAYSLVKKVPAPGASKGLTGPVKNAVKGGKDFIKRVEYELYYRDKQIKKLQKQIETLRVYQKYLNMLTRAIQTQFPEAGT